jgi:hypothetical protein
LLGFLLSFRLLKKTLLDFEEEGQVMIHDPAMIILLHHYRKAKPAIDESEYLNHGLCINTNFIVDGAKPGSGALEFKMDSVVRVPKSPSWDQLRGLIVDVQVRFDGSNITTRRNIVEGDGCFAFYVAPGGDLRFDFFTNFIGQPNPDWYGVSSVSHAITQPVQLLVGRWYRLRASFDALTTARIWIDGELVAQRSGFRSGVGSPGGQGVSIGNWTLSNQFPLLGALDWVAIWKLDEDVVTKNFVERLDSDAKRGWSDFMACLDEQFNDENIRALQLSFEDLLVEENECISGMDDPTRSKFYELVERYQELWEVNDIDRPDFHSVVVEIYRLLSSYCGNSFSDRLVSVSNTFEEIRSRIGDDCWSYSQLKNRDPVIQSAFDRFSEDEFVAEFSSEESYESN